MKPEIWTKEADSWDVKAAEKDIHSIKRFAGVLSVTALERAFREQILHVIYENQPDLEQLVVDAGKEMADIIQNKDNSSGYHLNHITTGKTVYTLWNNNGEVRICKGFFGTKEEADEYAKTFNEAVVQKADSDDKTVYEVLVLDEESTEHMRSENYGGEYVASFDTIDEAEAEAASLDRYYILEMPSEEWWIVVNNETGKAAYPVLFPSQTLALAYLYKAAKPKAWMEYVKYFEEDAKNE